VLLDTTMVVGPVGSAAPLSRADREALWVRLAIYLDRSSAHLRDAWDLDESRVRQLPRFARAQLDYEMPIKAAHAASLFGHRGLLAYAEELRARVNWWYPEQDSEHPFQRAIIACAIEHAKSRCGLSHESDAAFARLLARVREKGRFGVSHEVCLRAGRTEIVPFVERGTVFSADVLIAFMREAGPDAFGALCAGSDIRLPLDEPLPKDDATRFYRFLREDRLVSHQLLLPSSRAHEHVDEAIAALMLSAPESAGSMFTPIRNTAAVLAIAAGIDDEKRMAQAVSALRGRALWLITDALHFPRVRDTLVRSWRAFAPSPSPCELAVLEALAVFTLDDARAAKVIAASTKAAASAGREAADPALSALFRISMQRALPLSAYRVTTKMLKMHRRGPTMEIARAYAEAGDFGGLVEVLAAVDGINQCAPEQTNPLASCVLRSLQSGPATSS
jgi:hypothetical protein